jgi:hypothetical protein
MCFVIDDVAPYVQLIQRCKEAIGTEWILEERMVSSGFVSQQKTALLQLEKKFLDIGSKSGLTQGVFYSLVLGDGKSTVVRFFESGCYLGFMHAKGKELLGSTVGVSPTDLCCLRIYTEDDIDKQRIHQEQRKDVKSSGATASVDQGSSCTDMIFYLVACIYVVYGVHEFILTIQCK